MTNKQPFNLRSFVSGFLLSTILFLVPILLFPNLQASYMYFFPGGMVEEEMEEIEEEIEEEEEYEEEMEDEYDDEMDDESSAASSVDSSFAIFDSSASSFGFEDICDDGVDNDGDGMVDDLDEDCEFMNIDVSSSSSWGLEVCDDGADNDGDGMVDDLDEDCMGAMGSSEWSESS